MKILILSSSSRHFPLDIQASLKEAGLESDRLESLNEFIASPLRKEPFLAILEVGTTEDIDRALVAYEWAETVQPLAAARYLLLVGSKHISLQDKAGRFRGVEVAQLPLPAKNLLFKIDLQLKVLASGAKAQTKEVTGFSAEIREVERQRVMVIRGPGPKAGGWKDFGNTPQGRIRWRWIDDPPKKGKPEENFSWTTESKVAPEFNPREDAWEVKDPEADLQCHRDGKEIFSAKKSGLGELLSPDASAETKNSTAAGPTALAPAPTESKGEVPKGSAAAGTQTPSAAKNNPVLPSHGAAAAQPAPQPTIHAEAKPKEPAAVNTPGEKSNPKPATANSAAAPAEPKPTATAAASERINEPRAKAKTDQPEPSAAPEPAAKATGVMPASPSFSDKRASGDPSHPSPEKSPGHRPEENEKEKLAPKAAALSAPEKSAKAPSEAEPAKAMERPSQETQNTPSSNAAPSPMISAEKQQTSVPASPAAKETLPEPAPKPNAALTATASSPKEAAVSASGQKPAAAPTLPTEQGEKQNTPAPTRERSDESPAEAPAKGSHHSRILRTEVIDTGQSQPAVRGTESGNTIVEKKREVTGKIVIPAGQGRSEHQDLVRASGSKAEMENSRVSSAPVAEPEGQPLKTRLFLTLSLEELQDQNSSWMPVEGYRIYLSAQNRYYGIKNIEEIFPLWIYEGELAPEFLDLQKAWKFYDRLPLSYRSLESLPAPITRYLLEMKGSKAEPVETKSAEKTLTPAEGAGVKHISSGKDDKPSEPPAKKPLFSAAWFLEVLSRLLGR